MMTTKPTLLECLRMLEPHTDKITNIHDAIWLDCFCKTVIIPSDFDSPYNCDMLYIEHCLIQIAKKKEIPVQLSYGMTSINHQVYDAAFVYDRAFVIGKDNIETMTHALALGLCWVLKLWEGK